MSKGRIGRFRAWHRRLAVVHLVLLAVLYWLAADADAHRWVHHHGHARAGECCEPESDLRGHVAGLCMENAVHGVDGHVHGGGAEAAEAHDTEEPAADDCAVTLLQQGKWAFDPAPPPGMAPVSVRITVAGFGPPPADFVAMTGRLPFSCGPPSA